MVLVNGGFLHCTDKEILVNSSLKATKKNWLEQSQKIRWAIQGHLGPLVSICHTGFSEDGRCHCFILSSSSIRPDKKMNKRMGKNELFNRITRKTSFLIFCLTWLVRIQNETNKKTIESFCLVRLSADSNQSTKIQGSAKWKIWASAFGCSFNSFEQCIIWFLVVIVCHEWMLK